MTKSQEFYASLPVLSAFVEATDIGHYVDVPDDWSVVITDVIGSTKAIEAGAYKNVNTIGVATIAAVTNVDRAVEIPYVFGGDGATFAIPDYLVPQVSKALNGARCMAKDGFGLDLRVGIVSAVALRRENQWVRLAKLRLSPHVTQPAFAGRGWEVAERWVKSPELGTRFAVPLDPSASVSDADFSGFECRWLGVKSFRGHKLAVLVLGTAAVPEDNMLSYKRIMERIHGIYGEVKDFHPLRPDALKLSVKTSGLAPETTVRAFDRGRLGQWFYRLGLLLKNVLGRSLLAVKIPIFGIDWGGYQNEVVDNSDFRKFDGMLRMVIDGDDAQYALLRAYLEKERSAGRLVYGLHRSREALVTCIVRSYNNDHTHFVDGSDGGYALAARELKKQLADRTMPS